MSIGSGSSALGTLLVQRLDAVLGTTLSQQSNLVSGARPDAVSQPGQPDRTDPARNDIQRHPQDNVNRAAGQIDAGRKQVGQARTDTGQIATARPAPSVTSSAQTSLGPAARLILDLLTQFPAQMSVHGKAPLLAERPGMATTAATPSGAANNAQVAGAAVGTASPAAGNRIPAGVLIDSLPGALPSSGALAGRFAQALSQAVQGSGMFYESHLAELAFGKRSAEQLRQEPQAQSGRESSGTGARQAGEPASQSSPATTNSNNSSAPTSASQPSHPAAPASQPGMAAASGMPPDTQMLVRQQLEVLANQSFSWRGEAWPDTGMEWEIERQTGGRSTADETEHWATRISVHLPNLGLVQARLTLAGTQIVMHVEAAEAAEQLSQHVPTLRGRLSAVGLSLSQLSIAAQPDTTTTDPTPNA